MKKGRNVMYYYLVRDIISPIYFHQSANVFLTKFGVMIIVMMPPQDLEKVGCRDLSRDDCIKEFIKRN